MNRWAMVFPCLMYLACVGTCSCHSQDGGDLLIDTIAVAMGVAQVCLGSRTGVETATALNFNTAYLSISLSLNVLLTIMIVTRLIVHIRNVRKTIGTSDGLHTAAATVVTMLTESYALYAVTLLIYIVPLAVNSSVQYIFFAATGPIQVCAAFIFPRYTASLGCWCLIMVTHRSSLRI